LTAVFSRPVVVALGYDGKVRRIGSPREAAECLTSWSWPDKSGVQFENAIGMCLKALAGERSPEEARSAFLAAARRAHVLVDAAPQASKTPARAPLGGAAVAF
jgi:hypothetical protein